MLTDDELIKRLRLLNEVDANVAADRIKVLTQIVAEMHVLVPALRAKIDEYFTLEANNLEAAFNEGFSEGNGGGWIEGDPSPAWAKSQAKANLK